MSVEVLWGPSCGLPKAGQLLGGGGLPSDHSLQAAHKVAAASETFLCMQGGKTTMETDKILQKLLKL